MPSDISPDDNIEAESKSKQLRRIFETLSEHTGAFALYALLLALVVSVVVRFELPSEYWLALTGLLTGLGQQMGVKAKPDDKGKEKE